MSTFRKLLENSDTERVVLDINNISALQNLAQSLSKENFAKGMKSQKKLFKRKILFKNVDWDTVYNKFIVSNKHKK